MSLLVATSILGEVGNVKGKGGEAGLKSGTLMTFF